MFRTVAHLSIINLISLASTDLLGTITIPVTFYLIFGIHQVPESTRAWAADTHIFSSWFPYPSWSLALPFYYSIYDPRIWMSNHHMVFRIWSNSSGYRIDHHRFWIIQDYYQKYNGLPFQVFVFMFSEDLQGMCIQSFLIGNFYSE